MMGTRRAGSMIMIAVAVVVAAGPAWARQNSKTSQQLTGSAALNPPSAASPEEAAAIESQLSSVYQNFYRSYRLGPSDAIAIHIDKHPEDSLDRVAVSPFGQVYFALLGNVQVGGKTLPELETYFTTTVSEFIRDPHVTVTLLEVNSAKIGVLGDVRAPGVVLMNRPMKVLDAITAAGGITDLGSASDVAVLRQYEDGRLKVTTVNIKKILKGQGTSEDNSYLQPGDTIIVHGNLIKKIGTATSMLGVANFLSFVARGGH